MAGSPATSRSGHPYAQHRPHHPRPATAQDRRARRGPLRAGWRLTAPSLRSPPRSRLRGVVADGGPRLPSLALAGPQRQRHARRRLHRPRPATSQDSSARRGPLRAGWRLTALSLRSPPRSRLRGVVADGGPRLPALAPASPTPSVNAMLDVGRIIPARPPSNPAAVDTDLHALATNVSDGPAISVIACPPDGRPGLA
jgi:hypothetical protein